MASAIQTHQEEPTFKQFTPTQAKDYAINRGGYQDRFLQVILDHHGSTGGAFGTLVDVGCGPGKTTTRPLAKRFDTAYGIDPSPEMINTAKLLGAESHHEDTASGKQIQFLVGTSEDLSGSIGDPHWKVDLLTAGTAVRATRSSVTIALLIAYRHIGSTWQPSGPLQLACSTRAERSPCG